MTEGDAQWPAGEVTWFIMLCSWPPTCLGWRESRLVLMQPPLFAKGTRGSFLLVLSVKGACSFQKPPPWRVLLMGGSFGVGKSFMRYVGGTGIEFLYTGE
jgi:hypothetical protein